VHLLSLSYSRPRLASIDTAAFPFSVRTIRTLEQLKFETPITFLVGENGSGKSTLLEALAIAAHSVTVGSAAAENDETLNAVRLLARHLRLVWRKRSHKGFFLRAEDYFGYVRRLNKVKADLETDARRAAEDYARAGRSGYAASLAQMPYRRELADLRERYGEGGLDSRSHGESFLAFFQSRFVPGGLYLLDEPEAPLSPIRQLALVAALKQMVEQDAQFIIATHSPIVMACPGATILNFDSTPIQAVAYDELEHVTFTRAFLANPNLYLRHLQAGRGRG
jgi:predicted ATPase